MSCWDGDGIRPLSVFAIGRQELCAALIAPELEGCRQSAWEKPSEFIRQELLNIGNNNTVVHLEDVLQFDRQACGRVKKRVLVLLMNVRGLSGPREELGTSSYSSK